ncbi:MAG TPA: hypothetical protein VFN57_02695 [Thermomicrobiaceae bacterium]|nr:hypothetical protein [Thermomicrobiaceae bacterium]
MEVDETSGIAIAVAATAAIMSPRVRHTVRRGLVFGLAGIMMAGDAVASFAHGVSRGAQQISMPGTDTAEAGGEAHATTEGA